MFIDKNGVVRMPKAYLAGTEIFYKDTKETQEKYHQLCDKYGIIGFYPEDIAPDDEFKEYVKKDDSLQELEKQLSFEGGINTALVATILDRVVVKKESTKEEIHLDIYLKFGQKYKAIYSPHTLPAGINPPRSTMPRPRIRRI
jgi:hypothetical protein